MNKAKLYNDISNYIEFLNHELRAIGQLVVFLLVFGTIKLGISPIIDDLYYLNVDVVHKVVHLVNDYCIIFVCYFSLLAILYYVTYKLIPDDKIELSRKDIILLLITQFFDFTYKVKFFRAFVCLIFSLSVLSVCTTTDTPLVSYNELNQFTSITLNLNQSWSFAFSLMAIVTGILSTFSAMISFINLFFKHVVLHNNLNEYREDKLRNASALRSKVRKK